MGEFATPQVVVSKCLEFDACRYNGEMIPNKTIQRLSSFVNFIPVCPEVEIGLGVPRDTIRLVDNNGSKELIQPSTKKNITGEMHKFSERFIKSLQEVDGFLLKNRSPTCGISDAKVYTGAEKGSATKELGSGLFAEAVLSHFSGCAVEDEGRLSNFTIREHFYTKIFTLAAFKEKKRTQKIHELVNFHARQKFLLMAYDQKSVKELGNIAANHERLPAERVFEKYEAALKHALQQAPSTKRYINVCEHVFGFLSSGLHAGEKAFFLDMLERYREKKIPLTSITSILKSWAVRFEEAYLLRQSFFLPYPEELVEISDSGKGRAYT
ncbi:DUF523 and DUF1722 domain-containing protein [Thalassobacillus sp. C254]|uniref:YbgA family protein n=1 Tax=Thalassobacillus sp. C254 TaxID=1225341 RepID=UPI0006D1A187|nr:DUF523 and DUF1722 domain-containing protein [Thalassobacillus sp. C254]